MAVAERKHAAMKMAVPYVTRIAVVQLKMPLHGHMMMIVQSPGPIHEHWWSLRQKGKVYLQGGRKEIQ